MCILSVYTDQIIHIIFFYYTLCLCTVNGIMSTFICRVYMQYCIYFYNLNVIDILKELFIREHSLKNILTFEGITGMNYNSAVAKSGQRRHFVPGVKSFFLKQSLS